MERLSPSGGETGALLFNSPLETGVRAVVILSAAYPRAFDLTFLTWLDHLVVHTGDISGPPSLHPGTPSRNGEILVRRRLIEESLKLMRRLNFVEERIEKDGIYYVAADDSYAFVNLLRTKYSIDLRERAEWLADFIGRHSELEIKSVMTDKIGRWNVEFQIESDTSGRIS